MGVCQILPLIMMDVHHQQGKKRNMLKEQSPEAKCFKMYYSVNSYLQQQHSQKYRHKVSIQSSCKFQFQISNAMYFLLSRERK